MRLAVTTTIESTLSICVLTIYTRLEKRCGVQSIKDGQCDTMEIWEEGRGKFATGFRFLIYKIFYFQGNLKSKLRHAVLL